MRDLIEGAKAVDNLADQSYPQFEHSLPEQLATPKWLHKVLKLKGNERLSGY